MLVKAHVCILSVFLIFIGMSDLHAQKESRHKAHHPISCPEFWWGMGHPFIAIKAFRLSKQALDVTREVEKEGQLVNDRRGGQLDAFKHAFWMGMLCCEIGEKKALKLGVAHEKGNFRQFKRNKRKGRKTWHDAVNRQMDLLNNQTGASLAKQFPGLSPEEFQELIIDHIQAGRLIIVKKNNRGEYVDERNHVLSADSLNGKWETAKCLVPSDYLYGDEIYKNLH